jgi:hypothetical protein
VDLQEPEPEQTEQVELDPEEREWNYRQQLTGSVGRLVKYSEDECPKQDIRLRGGCGRRVVVTSVTTGGNAFMAGVKAGDVLVSLNGKKDFKEMSAEALQDSLIAPLTLVFMGFCGKLQAEVRLNQKEKECGLSSNAKVPFGSVRTPVRVVDEVIFQPSGGTILLATLPRTPSRPSGIRPHQSGTGSAEGCDHEPAGSGREGRDQGVEGTGGTCEGMSPRGEALTAVYEIRGLDAKQIVSHALSHPLLTPRETTQDIPPISPPEPERTPQRPQATIRIPQKPCVNLVDEEAAAGDPDSEDDAEICLEI